MGSNPLDWTIDLRKLVNVRQAFALLLGSFLLLAGCAHERYVAALQASVDPYCRNQCAQIDATCVAGNVWCEPFEACLERCPIVNHAPLAALARYEADQRHGSGPAVDYESKGHPLPPIKYDPDHCRICPECESCKN